MLAFYYWLIALLIILLGIAFLAGLNLGKRKMYKLSPEVTDKMVESKYKVSWDTFAYLSAMAVLCLMVACLTSWEVVEKTINDYRANRIVEKITYQHKVIDGVEVATDTTFTYVRNK